MGCISPYLFILGLCLLFFAVQPALSQTIVDPSFCSSFQKKCGSPGSSTSEKYCCVESNGGLTLYKCCNPYIGLIAGLCVGVPVIILIIVGVVVAYCVCAHYQNKKMVRLAAAYSNRRVHGRSSGDRNYLAPPAYTPTTDTQTAASELPAYSATDPYTSTTTTPQAIPKPSAEEETGDPAGDTTTIQLDDIPLLSDN